MSAAHFQRLSSVPVRKQSKVPDLYEARRQDVKQEAPDELGGVESHDAASVVVPGVTPTEAHLSVLKTEESSVGNGNAMGVAGQILQHMFRSTEGRLGVDHPLFSSQAGEQR